MHVSPIWVSHTTYATRQILSLETIVFLNPIPCCLPPTEGFLTSLWFNPLLEGSLFLLIITERTSWNTFEKIASQLLFYYVNTFPIKLASTSAVSSVCVNRTSWSHALHVSTAHLMKATWERSEGEIWRGKLKGQRLYWSLLIWAGRFCGFQCHRSEGLQKHGRNAGARA